MLKEQTRLLAALTFAADLTAVAGAFLMAFWVRSSLLPDLWPQIFSTPLHRFDDYLPLLPVVLAIWSLLLLGFGSYRSHRTVPLLEEARQVLAVSLAGLALLALTVYVTRLDARYLNDDELSRVFVLLVVILAFCFLLAERLALRTVSRYVRTHGLNYRSVLIVGTTSNAFSLAESMRHHRYWGFKIIGFIDHGTDRASGSGSDGPPSDIEILGSFDDILEIVDRYVVDDVYFCVSRRDLDQLEDLFLALHEQGIRTRFDVDLFPHTKTTAKLEVLDGTPLLTFSTTSERFLALLCKRGIDVVLSASLLAIGLPIVLTVALVIRLSSHGGVLFRQTRCGLNGRRFTLYKFRTMFDGADERQRELLHLNEMDGPVFKISSDPRVTGFGRFLRRFSLDELPQLWNVLRGDMSLVGPRPPIPDEVDRYQRWQRRRLSMRPGLTCLWQVSGRNQIDFDRWMKLDLEYIDCWSPLLDFKILAKTVPAVLSGRGAS